MIGVFAAGHNRQSRQQASRALRDGRGWNAAWMWDIRPLQMDAYDGITGQLAMY